MLKYATIILLFIYLWVLEIEPSMLHRLRMGLTLELHLQPPQWFCFVMSVITITLSVYSLCAMYAHVCAGTLAQWASVETRGCHWLSILLHCFPSVVFCVFFLFLFSFMFFVGLFVCFGDRVSHWTQSLPFHLAWLANNALGCLTLGSQTCHTVPTFYRVAGDPGLGPHICAANVLPRPIFPGPVL